MSRSLFRRDNVCVLPYPDGKTFAFTIIDDTDESTLETARLIYDCLFSLGLKTTKTVWVTPPSSPTHKPCDSGDTLERADYAEYINLLKQRGFEIALHNVSSTSNTRAAISAGLAAFIQIVGDSPKINVHHEKNAENIYFEFAQSGRHLPRPFRTTLFNRVHKILGRDEQQTYVLEHGCSGENPKSEYFWGDLCKANIRYVRTNVFLRDLNTLKCSPAMPYALTETPYVNYWFDSSDGQDVHQFNRILSDKNIDSLRREQGCCVLYTHFGKGFVEVREGAVEFNSTARQRLRAIAGHPEGWYAPVSEILDRLLAFQRVAVLQLPGGVLLQNQNDFSIHSITLRTEPGTTYFDSNRRTLTANSRGQLVIPVLDASASLVLMRDGAAGRARRWNEDTRPGLLIDLAKVAQKIGMHFPRHDRGNTLGTRA